MQNRAVVVAFALAAVVQADAIRSHFANAAGTAERPAVSAAWIAGGRTEFANFGRQTLPDGAPPANDTIYEIGSITKTFTATLLADMVLSKEVAFETTIGELLPAKNYSADARRITLLALATHSSGLPRLPNNMFVAAAKAPLNPYAHYTPDDLDAYMRGYAAESASPQPLYSNIGVGLLGYALAAKAGKSYEQLITERVLAPLGVGFVVETLWPRPAQGLLPYVGILSNVAMVVMIVATVLGNLEAVLDVFGTGAILAAILLIGGAFMIGYLLGTFDKREKKVLGLATAQRNFAAATVVATQSFTDPDVLVMAVVCSTIAMVLLLPLSRLLGRRAAQAA